MQKEALELAMHRDAVQIENALAKYYTEDEDIARLLEAERYSLLGGGKRIRPILTLAFCRLFGGEDEAAMPFACAVEMIHTYSLIHDDLPCMDDDDLRRGRKTNHKVFGEAMAILAGDALLTGAFEAAASNVAAGAEMSAKAVAFLASSAGRYGMVGGQVMDLLGEERQLTADELVKLHSLKTGALISASAVLGALAAGVDFCDERMQDVLTYSEKLGLAFQIRDDVLDATGDTASLGKTVGMDAKRKKNTFATLFSVEEATFFADRLTAEAIDALQPYEENDFLCSLARWLADRTK